MTTAIVYGTKGGAGTSTVAASLALINPHHTLLIDREGELPALLGVPEPIGPGLNEWITSGAPTDHLDDLTFIVNDTTTLLPAGRRTVDENPERWDELTTWANERADTVIVDAGHGTPPIHVTDSGTNLLVTRACYLALRRAINNTTQIDGIILINEPGRALRGTDIEAALAKPVIAQIDIDPSIARAIDAGLITTRVPARYRQNLEPALSVLELVDVSAPTNERSLLDRHPTQSAPQIPEPSGLRVETPGLS